jgi:hypothetical protein
MTVAQKKTANKPEDAKGKKQTSRSQVSKRRQKIARACRKDPLERALSHKGAQGQLEELDALDSQVKEFLEHVSEEVARETGFIKRKRAITGALFAQVLIFGWMIQPEASYTQLQQMLAILGCTASAQALEQRMNERGADFLLTLLYGLLGVCVESEGVMCEVLQRFKGVYLQDGTLVTLPDELEGLFEGCGGNSDQGGRSGLRLQVRLNLSTGELQGPWLKEAVQCEREGAGSIEQDPLPEGSLHLVDLAYVTLEKMKTYAQTKRWWLTTARADWRVTDARGITTSLPEWIKSRKTQLVIDEWVTVGSQAGKKQRVRLLAFRVGEERAKQRREQNNRNSKTRPKGCRRDVRVGKKHQRPSIDGRHRRKSGKKRLELADWTILLTNVPEALLAPHEARVLMRARWQIELLWRLWKERGQIDIWRSEKPMRILCEIYAKIIGQVIQHWLILRACWQQPHRSLVKASKAVQWLALAYLLSLSGPITPQRVKQLLQQAMQRSRVNTRPKRCSTSHLLEEPTRVCPSVDVYWTRFIGSLCLGRASKLFSIKSIIGLYGKPCTGRKRASD